MTPNNAAVLDEGKGRVEPYIKNRVGAFVTRPEIATVEINSEPVDLLSRREFRWTKGRDGLSRPVDQSCAAENDVVAGFIGRIKA